MHDVALDSLVEPYGNIWFSRNLEMAESKPGLRKPVFTKVDQLRPGTSGHTLTVKVVSTKMVMQKGRPDGPQPRQMRIAECMVGDETGVIIFTARNDQGINVIDLVLFCGDAPIQVFLTHGIFLTLLSFYSHSLCIYIHTCMHFFLSWHIVLQTSSIVKFVGVCHLCSEVH